MPTNQEQAALDSAISEDDFEARFCTLEDENGSALREFDAVKNTDEKHVWTIVTAANDKLYAEAGFHIVNKIGYIVTREPWTDPLALAIWCDNINDTE